MWIWAALAVVVVAGGLFAWRIERELSRISGIYAESLAKQEQTNIDVGERVGESRLVLLQHAERLLVLETENKADAPKQRTDRFAGWQDQRARAERAAS